MTFQIQRVGWCKECGQHFYYQGPSSGRSREYCDDHMKAEKKRMATERKRKQREQEKLGRQKPAMPNRPKKKTPQTASVRKLDVSPSLLGGVIGAETLSRPRLGGLFAGLPLAQANEQRAKFHLPALVAT